MSSILFFCVSFFASIAGAICGIGGGVIIKPVLDIPLKPLHSCSA